MSTKWNLSQLLKLLNIHGAEVGEDNDGQIVIYTGFRENENGNLERMDDEEHVHVFDIEVPSSEYAGYPSPSDQRCRCGVHQSMFERG